MTVQPVSLNLLGPLLHVIGGRVAMVDGDGRGWPGSELADLLQSLCAGAEAAGLAPGHRVALILPDHPATAVAILGLSERLSVLPLNNALTQAEQAEILVQAGVDAVIALPQDAAAAALAQVAGALFLSFAPETGMLRATGALPAPTIARPAGLVLLTSGSTGTPKRVPLRADQLWHSARTIAQTLALSPTDRVAHALPMFHVGALVDLVLAPLVSGGSVALCPARTPAAMAATVLAQGASWAQMVPTMLARCLAEFDPVTAQAVGARLRFIRSVSSDLAPVRQAEAEALFGTALVQMYGLTETCGQVASNAPPPGQRKPGSVGRIAGPEVVLLDPTGSPVPQGAEGEICIRGPAVTTGYEDAAREAQFHGPWLRSGDLGRLDSEGFLHLTGRRKEMINRGGEKIAPVEVERAAMAVPGVAEAVAYAVPHPTYGEQVGLAVTLGPGVVLSGEEVQRALTPRLAPFKLPRSVEVMAELPRLGGGKIDRSALRRRAGPAVAAVAVLSPLARQVAAIWAAVLQGPLPQPDEDFFDAGGDSLSATEFLLRLETALGHPVPGNLLFEAPRFTAFVDHLAAYRPPAVPQDAMEAFLLRETAAWPGQRSLPGGLILGTATVGEKVPLFFCAQGNFECLAIREVLAPDRPLYIMRSLYLMPGRHVQSDHALARRYAGEIGRIRPEGPLHLGGFCAGARVMEAAAQILLAEGREVALFVSIDHAFSRPASFAVLQGWTECDYHPPSAHFLRPRMGFALMYPAGTEVLGIEGIHMRALTPERMRPLGEMVERLMEGKTRILPPAPTQDLSLPARRALQAARLRVCGPRVLRAGVNRMKVRVHNLAGGEWPSGPGAGFALSARLLHLDGRVLKVRVGDADLPGPLGPGAAVEVEMSVAMPRVAALCWLEIALVDQGIAVFDPQTAPPARRRVLILPFGSG